MFRVQGERVDRAFPLAAPGGCSRFCQAHPRPAGTVWALQGPSWQRALVFGSKVEDFRVLGLGFWV